LADGSFEEDQRPRFYERLRVSVNVRVLDEHCRNSAVRPLSGLSPVEHAGEHRSGSSGCLWGRSRLARGCRP